MGLLMLGDKDAAAQFFEEGLPRRGTPPAGERVSTAVAEDDKIRFDFMGDLANLGDRVTKNEPTVRIESPFMKAGNAFMEDGLVMFMICTDDVASIEAFTHGNT